MDKRAEGVLVASRLFRIKYAGMSYTVVFGRHGASGTPARSLTHSGTGSESALNPTTHR